MEQQTTGIEKISFNFKDIILIVTIVLSVVTNQLTVGAQVQELARKFEQSQIHQQEMAAGYRELISLQIRTLELRIDKLENQKSK